MILSGPEITKILQRTRRDRADGTPPMMPCIDIEPFNPDHMGPNSYDITLGDSLVLYEFGSVPWLDARKVNPTYTIKIPPDGLVIRPNVLYLGSTVERTITHGVVPWVDGRSSIGRLGIQIHMTAGRGDDGFGGVDGCNWTLEITCVHQVKIYAGMRIGQITFFHMTGERSPYKGKYQSQSEPTPSKLHEDKR